MRRRRASALCEVCELYAANRDSGNGRRCAQCQADHGGDDRQGPRFEQPSRQTIYRREVRAERIAEGLCVDCTAPAVGGVRCRACAADNAARAKAYYHAHAERCRQAANARYHAAHPGAAYRGPRPRREVRRAA